MGWWLRSFPPDPISRCPQRGRVPTLERLPSGRSCQSLSRKVMARRRNLPEPSPVVEISAREKTIASPCPISDIFGIPQQQLYFEVCSYYIPGLSKLSLSNLIRKYAPNLNCRYYIAAIVILACSRTPNTVRVLSLSRVLGKNIAPDVEKYKYSTWKGRENGDGRPLTP